MPHVLLRPTGLRILLAGSHEIFLNAVDLRHHLLGGTDVILCPGKSAVLKRFCLTDRLMGSIGPEGVSQ